MMDNKLSKPVAWEMRFWNSGHGCWHEWERITAEQHAEMSVQHAADNDYEFRALYDAPPAPAVPDIKIQKAILWLDGVIQSNPGMKEPVTCRAAMLAQPVSQSYKLPVELHNYDGGCVVFGAADEANEAPEGGK